MEENVFGHVKQMIRPDLSQDVVIGNAGLCTYPVWVVHEATLSIYNRQLIQAVGIFVNFLFIRPAGPVQAL